MRNVFWEYFWLKSSQVFYCIIWSMLSLIFLIITLQKMRSLLSSIELVVLGINSSIVFTYTVYVDYL